MHITREADNALRIVHALATNNRRMAASEISDVTDVSFRFSLKILRKLMGQGIVRSYMGKYGGYELNKSPKEITVGEILRTADGPFQLNQCLDENHLCARQDGCPFHVVFCEMSRQINEQFDHLTMDLFCSPDSPTTILESLAAITIPERKEHADTPGCV